MTTLVLLPGMDGSGLLFKPFVTALAGKLDVRVIRYPASDPLSYGELEELARSSLPGTEPLVLLGESFSGPIAVSLAAAMPNRVKGLILCCTFVRNPRPFFSPFRPLLPLLPAGHIPLGFLSYVLLGNHATTALRSALARALAQVDPDVLRARLRAVLSVDVSAKLATIKAPILYLRAADDRTVPRAASELVVRLAPHTRIVEFSAPHFLLQTQPTQSAVVVSEFVAEASG